MKNCILMSLIVFWTICSVNAQEYNFNFFHGDKKVSVKKKNSENSDQNTEIEEKNHSSLQNQDNNRPSGKNKENLLTRDRKSKWELGASYVSRNLKGDVTAKGYKIGVSYRPTSRIILGLNYANYEHKTAVWGTYFHDKSELSGFDVSASYLFPLNPEISLFTGIDLERLKKDRTPVEEYYNPDSSKSKVIGSHIHLGIRYDLEKVALNVKGQFGQNKYSDFARWGDASYGGRQRVSLTSTTLSAGIIVKL